MRLNGLYREDVPEISVEAIREAIINAFCHRDYYDPDFVHIAVFKDRVEIRNPGGLYGGLTIDEIRKGNISKRRNPLIAELLRRIHMVEAWGRGMPLILENEPNVQFREIANIFIASFERLSYYENKGQRSKDRAEKSSEKSSEKGSEKGSEKTGDRIVGFLSDKPEMTILELSEALHISTRAVEKQIAKLQNEGILERIGGRKKGHWQVRK